MYFNRKNAEQKNWRMIKKGKHFLFGCSLVFAVGAALVAPSVKADAVDAKPEASSTAEGVKPAAAEEKTTYAAPAVEVAPAAVAEKKVETTQNSKEEPVVATEKAKEADSIQAPEVTVVYNPSALTDEEKAKVVAAVKAANSAATDVQVQADGSVVVTFADGSTASLSAAQTIKDGSQVAKPRRARAAVAAPVITSNLDGKGSSATDVTVQAPAGSTVKLYNTDGAVIGQAVANAQGVATVTPTNSLPVGEITATATPAGESESPKSAPVTATRPTLTTVEGGVSRGNDSDNTQLLVTKSHITVYPGESVKIGVVAVSQEMENFSVPKNPDGVKGLLPTGVYLKTAGTETYKRRNNGYGGTVAWDQPAGDTVVTFAVRSKNNVVVTRDLKVTVLELTKKLDAVPGEKVEVADLNNVSEDEKNKIIAATKKANASFPPGTLYNVDQRGNLVVTYPDKSTDKIDASYLVTPSNKPADTNKPAGQAPEITSDLSGKASTPTDVTVKAEPGSTVKLYNNDGVVIGEAVANDQGIATISPINSLPEGQITATATPAGGSESPKSTPITATRAEKPEVDGGVSRGNDNTQLLVTRSHITVYPGESVNVGVTAASNAIQNFWVPNNPTAVKGLKPTGYYISTAGTDTIRQRSAGYGGTVDWDQPAGDTVVTFAVRSKKNAVVTRDLKVTVLELTKKLDAVPGEKVEVANPNNVSEDEKNKIIAATTKANASFPPGTTYSVDEKGNLVITYPDKSTDKIAAAYLVTPAARETDKYTPTAKNQTVKQGETPDAKNSIANAGELPSGTTFAYKTPVDTATKGEKDAIVVVTYPDKSTDEVPVKVTVKDPRSDADKNDPKPKAQDIYKGSTPDAKGSIANAGDLPYGTSFAYKTPVDTETPGEKDATVVVTYPDGSKDEVPVKVTVEDPDKTSAENNTPTAKDQTVKVGEEPKAEASIGNFDKLPKGTKAEFKTPVDTTTPGEKDAIVVVTYPDSLTYEVPVKVTVKDPRSDADKNDPKAKAQDVNKGETPDAKGSIDNVGELPNGTTFAYKTPVDTETPGEKDATVVVTYPDKSTDEVPVKVTVKEPSESATDADKYTPKAKAQDVNKGETPDAKGSIDNAGELPNGTTFAYKTPVDTETPGEKDATVVVTYPDKSTDEVPVKVTVKEPRTDADKNTPVAKDQSVKPGDKPNAKDSIGNVGDLPSGTKFEYKTPVDTTTEGDKDAIVVVTYPDGSKDEVPVKVTVKEPRTDADKNTPVAKDQSVKPGDKPNAKDSIGNVGDLPSGTKFEYKTPVDTTTEGDKDAIVVVTYPDGSKDEVPVKVTVKDPRTDADKNTPVAKDQSVKPGETPNAKDSIGNVGELPEGTTFEFKTPVDTTTPGDKGTTVVVTYPDGSKDEVPVTVTVKDPDKTSDAENNTPTAKDQTVKQGETPDAKNSIGNVGELPEGTTFEFKTPVDTTTPGDKGTTVVVTYPDGSKDEVPVKVTVKDSSALTQPEITADLTGKAGTKTPVEVTADPGTKVELFDKDGNKIGEGVTGEDGKASITPTVEIPAGPVTAKASKDGKTSDESAPKVATKDPAITPVVNPSALTDAEKAKVADEVKKANPTASKVEVGNDGTATVTFPDGSVAVLTPEKTVKEADSNGVKNPAITPVVNPSALTDAEKAKVADEVKKANPTASKVEVGNDGTATVTFPDGSVAVLTPEKTVKKATKESSANPASKKAGAKELPNTGTEQSNASVGLALLAAATGGLLFAKKRKEEE